VFRVSKADVACLAILFCVDLSVYAMLSNKHPTSPGPASSAALDYAEHVAQIVLPAPASSPPADHATTNAPAAAENDPFAPHGTFWQHHYGNYVVITVRDPSEPFDSILQIFKAGTLVYTTNSHTFFDPEEKDPEADYSSPQPPRPYANITGNGIPNLVVTEYSGGAHCCSIYHIFELGDEFREVATIDAADGGAIFTNLTANGTAAIQMSDWSYAYEFTSFAGSFAPDIILRYTDDKYQIAPELMFTEPPTDEEYAKLVQEVRDAYATPAEGETEVQSPGVWGSDATLSDISHMTFCQRPSMAVEVHLLSFYPF